MRFINHAFFRFLVWGAINTLVGYVVYVILLQFLPYLVSYTIAYVFGIFLSYFLNSKMVFKQELNLRKALKYPVVYVVQYLIGVISMYVFVQVFHVNKLYAPALVVLLTVPATFFLSRKIVSGDDSVKTAANNSQG